MSLKILRNPSHDEVRAINGYRGNSRNKSYDIIYHVLNGETLANTADICGCSISTVRRWVHRYNAQGIRGLRPRIRKRGGSGRPRKCTDAQVAEIVSFSRKLLSGRKLTYRQIKTELCSAGIVDDISSTRLRNILVRHRVRIPNKRKSKQK